MPNQQPNLEQQFSQPPQPISSPPQKPKFNLKYILIVVILAAIVGGGILAYQYWWLPRHETKPPEIIIKNQTANWQTYRNEEYGYEFRYPQNIEIGVPGVGYPPDIEKSTNIVLVHKDTVEEIFALEIPFLTKEEADLTLDDFVNRVAEGFEKKENLMIGGEQAVKLTFGKWDGKKKQTINISSLGFVADDTIVIFIKHNNQVFILQLLKMNDKILFNQILSTFKFIE